MRITYRTLLEDLKKMSEKQLNLDVTVYDSGNDEYFQVKDQGQTDPGEADILDENHPFLII